MTKMRDSNYGSWKRKSDKRITKQKNQVRVNNRLTMDNNERFKNVAMGYMIQVERLWAVQILQIRFLEQ